MKRENMQFIKEYRKGYLSILFTLLFTGCSEVDECLDLGGSYDYENCHCDYEINHPYVKNHNCWSVTGLYNKNRPIPNYLTKYGTILCWFA